MPDLISPIPLYSTINPNAGPNFDEARVTDLSRMCGAIACTLRSPLAQTIACRIQQAAKCKMGLLILHGKEWTDWDFAEAMLLNTKCRQARANGVMPDMVCLHYEGAARLVTEHDLIYAAVKDVWPNSLVHWYDFPGWGMGWSGSGRKGCVHADARHDARSYNLYATTAAEASMVIAQNAGDGQAIPWLSLTGVYRDSPSGWSYYEREPRSRDAMRNTAKLIRHRMSQFAGMVLYPGHSEVKIEPAVWDSGIADLVGWLNGVDVHR